MTSTEKINRRRWTGTLSEDVPTGPQGQPAHPAGSSFTVSTAIDVPGVGGVSFSVSRLSRLLLEAAATHARTAERLRDQATKQTGPGKWIQPGMEHSFTNESLLFDCFRECASAVVCAFGALDNFANELLPWHFVYVDPNTGVSRTREDLEGRSGVELRLSRVAAQATGRVNLRSAKPDLWGRLMDMKTLRDDISHPKADQAVSTGNPYGSVFARLFQAPLQEYVSDVEVATEHYIG